MDIFPWFFTFMPWAQLQPCYFPCRLLLLLFFKLLKGVRPIVIMLQSAVGYSVYPLPWSCTDCSIPTPSLLNYSLLPCVGRTVSFVIITVLLKACLLSSRLIDATWVSDVLSEQIIKFVLCAGYLRILLVQILMPSSYKRSHCPSQDSLHLGCLLTILLPILMHPRSKLSK